MIMDYIYSKFKIDIKIGLVILKVKMSDYNVISNLTMTSLREILKENHIKDEGLSRQQMVQAVVDKKLNYSKYLEKNAKKAVNKPTDVQVDSRGRSASKSEKSTKSESSQNKEENESSQTKEKTKDVSQKSRDNSPTKERKMDNSSNKEKTVPSGQKPRDNSPIKEKKVDNSSTKPNKKVPKEERSSISKSESDDEKEDSSQSVQESSQSVQESSKRGRNVVKKEVEESPKKKITSKTVTEKPTHSKEEEEDDDEDEVVKSNGIKDNDDKPVREAAKRAVARNIKKPNAEKKQVAKRKEIHVVLGKNNAFLGAYTNQKFLKDDIKTHYPDVPFNKFNTSKGYKGTKVIKFSKWE